MYRKMHAAFAAFGLTVLTVLLVGCSRPAQVIVSPLDPVPRLVVMSAYRPELDKLLEQADVTGSTVINGRTCTVGRLAGNDVVMVLSGVSMVNAAMTTQAVLDHFDVEGMVFSGIAGGVNPNLDIGDVTVPLQWGQYQEQLFARETPGGWNVGWHTDKFSHFGMMFPQLVEVTRKDGRPDSTEKKFWFQADPAMLDVAQRVASQVDLDDCTGQGVCLDREPRVIVGGNGVSGPTFVDNAAYRKWVWDTFQADALDMETAAVAHVAYVNRVPYIAFRSLSDLAGGGPGENELPTFFQLAAENSAAVVMAFLEEWAAGRR
jgi:adenosylhomocysteine nucleosidase